MMKFRENEDAVSPVIGVILMVAITVILAAIIAAFAFGMTGSLTPPKEVYVTTKFVNVEEVGTELWVTLQGGKDIGLLKEIDLLIDGVSATTFDGDFPTPLEVGQTYKFKLEEGPHNIAIRGHFQDNVVTVIAEVSYTP